MTDGGRNSGYCELIKPYVRHRQRKVVQNNILGNVCVRVFFWWQLGKIVQCINSFLSSTLVIHSHMIIAEVLAA